MGNVRLIINHPGHHQCGAHLFKFRVPGTAVHYPLIGQREGPLQMLPDGTIGAVERGTSNGRFQGFDNGINCQTAGDLTP